LAKWVRLCLHPSAGLNIVATEKSMKTRRLARETENGYDYLGKKMTYVEKGWEKVGCYANMIIMSWYGKERGALRVYHSSLII